MGLRGAMVMYSLSDMMSLRCLWNIYFETSNKAVDNLGLKFRGDTEVGYIPLLVYTSDDN